MFSGLALKSLMSFVMGPAGKVILLALAFVSWTVYQRADATRTCEATELQEELKEAQRQTTIAQGIAERARQRADDSAQEMAQIESAYEDLKNDLPSNCPIPDDIRDRLLRIQ